MSWFLKVLFKLGLLDRYWLKYDGKMIHVYGSKKEEFIEEKTNGRD